MPFRASDIKVTVTTKRIIKLFNLLIIWRIRLCSVDSFLMACGTIKQIRVCWIHRRKIFPYFELTRGIGLTHFGIEK